MTEQAFYYDKQGKYESARRIMKDRFDPVARCPRCFRVAHDYCYTLQGHKEVALSGLCEECFDQLFEEDDG